VRGGRQPAQQAGRAEDQRAGAHRGGEPAGGVGPPEPVEHHRIVLELPGADPTREHDDIRPGHIAEGRVHRQPQRAVVRPDLSLRVAHEDHVEAGDPLEDLVGPDGVEGGDPGEQGDGHLEVSGHADLRSSSRKRRR